MFAPLGTTQVRDWLPQGPSLGGNQSQLPVSEQSTREPSQQRRRLDPRMGVGAGWEQDHSVSFPGVPRAGPTVPRRSHGPWQTWSSACTSSLPLGRGGRQLVPGTGPSPLPSWLKGHNSRSGQGRAVMAEVPRDEGGTWLLGRALLESVLLLWFAWRLDQADP